jgi:hypothetical protein
MKMLRCYVGIMWYVSSNLVVHQSSISININECETGVAVGGGAIAAPQGAVAKSGPGPTDQPCWMW